MRKTPTSSLPGARNRASHGLIAAACAVAACQSAANARPSAPIDLAQLARSQPSPEISVLPGPAKGVRLVAKDNVGIVLAYLPSVSMRTGMIEADVTGEAKADADPTVKAFVGLAFAGSGPTAFELVYLRMKNGRSSVQLERNHAAQYVSEPDHGWRILRQTQPGAFESYVDLAPGRRTHMRLAVEPCRVLLFVDGRTQPTLTVPRLRASGDGDKVGLWVGPGTIGRFTNVRVTPAPSGAPPEKPCQVAAAGG